MKKRVAIVHGKIPFVRTPSDQVAADLLAALRRRGFAADLLQIPLQGLGGEGREEASYRNAFYPRLFDLSAAEGEGIDLLVTTGFPAYGVRHPNKACWLLDSPAMEGARNRKTDQDLAAFEKKMLAACYPVYAGSRRVSRTVRSRHDLGAPALLAPPPEGMGYRNEGYGDCVICRGDGGPELLIRALPLCGPDLKAHILEPCDPASLEALAESLGVGDRVRLTTAEDPETLAEGYARALCGFHGPAGDAYSSAPLAAFFAQKPVVTTQAWAHGSDFVTDRENGFVCPPDPDAVAQALTFLREHKAVAAQMGELGAAIFGGVGWDVVVDKLTASLV